MKTIQELYSEIMGSQELKEQFIEAAKAGKQEEFLKAHGCEATLQEVQAFLTAKQSEDAPLSFDELENAAGGECNTNTAIEAACSITVFACLGIAIASFTLKDHHVFQEKEGDGRMCSKN